MFEIGNTLREARVRRQVTLQQAEEDTKIRVKYIQAMENEEFDVMPGPTYVKGFLRTYSQYLELDPDVIVGEYRSRGSARTEYPEPFGGSSIIGSERRHRGRNTVLVVAIVCVVVLGVIYALGLNNGDENDGATRQGPPGIVTSLSPSPTASQKPTPTPSPDVAAGVVRISATEETWIEVRRDGPEGKVLFSGALARGKSKQFQGDVLWLRLGSPANVRLRVEGKRVAPLDDPAPSDYLIKDGKLKRQE
ncbi:MAG: DUF4115 domain-containing protein [Thermoleophilia bacterium]